jgi:tRNA pseudouridine55 synthase
MAIILWKKRYGETLALMLKRFRASDPRYIEVKVTYAGRLDPMAEGLIILLTEDDVHKKEEFLKLDKTYEVEFILGAETDTYDILGRIVGQTDAFDVVINDVEDTVVNLAGEHAQKYPPYSSRRVNGKPLWQWARDGLLDTIEIPSHDVVVKDSKYLGFSSYTEYNLSTKIRTSLSLVDGNFRQIEVMTYWQDFFYEHEGRYRVYVAEFKVSSGTYIRSLIHDLGKTLGVGAVCLKITRKQVGEYLLE